MKDNISIQRVALLHPKWRADAEAFLEDAENALNLTIRIVQGYRTFAEQDVIYQQGRTTPGKIVTYSPAGSSYHNYGVALDCYPFLSDANDLDWNFDFEKLRPFAIKYSITLGLDFPHKDSDHFENKYGLNWREMLHRYNTKDFIEGTQYIRI